MAYSPENNPYIPGDPYSYDLKWIVQHLKNIDSQLSNIDTTILQAVVKAYAEHGEPVVYNSMAELMAADQPANTLAYLTGYYSKGDGGASLYYITDDYNEVLAATTYITFVSGIWGIFVSLTPFVTPEMFGAKGDGAADDTAAINEAAKYHNVQFIQNKIYMVDAVSHAIPLSNSIWEGNGATLKAIPNNATHYAVIMLDAGQSNVTVKDIVIKGERDDHTGTTGEWGMAIQLENVSNINLDNIKASDCWGDGLYINKCDDIVIGSYSVSRARRNGVSVIDVDNLYIDHLYVEDTSGTAPEKAIDFEPNYSDERITHAVINTLVSVRNKAAVNIVNVISPDIHINTIISDRDGYVMTIGDSVQPDADSSVVVGSIKATQIETAIINSSKSANDYAIIINDMAVFNSPSIAGSSTYQYIVRLAGSAVAGGISINQLYYNGAYGINSFYGLVRAATNIKDVFINVTKLSNIPRCVWLADAAYTAENIVIRDPSFCLAYSGGGNPNTSTLGYTAFILPPTETANRTFALNALELQEGAEITLISQHSTRHITVTSTEDIIGLMTSAQTLTLNTGSVTISRIHGIPTLLSITGSYTVA